MGMRVLDNQTPAGGVADAVHTPAGEPPALGLAVGPEHDPAREELAARRVLAQLPETTGMPHEVVIQQRHRYRYDSVIRLPGARVVEVGGPDGTSADELDAAIGSKTAAVFVPAHLDGAAGTVRLADAIQIAHGRGVPVFVDAAYLIYPLELMRQLATSTADLVCFSAKYFGGPNSGGFVCGRTEWIEAVGRADFVSFELGQHRVLGRAFKLDRHTVIGTLAALEEWLVMDHDARLRGYARRVQTIAKHLGLLRGISLAPMCLTMAETLEPEPVNCLVLRVGVGFERQCGRSPHRPARRGRQRSIRTCAMAR